MLSFIDNFWMLGVIFLGMMPLLLFMKKAEPPKGPLTGH